MESIKIFVEDVEGTINEIEIPLGISLNLMEVLKSEGYNIEGVCGGMALCGTCTAEVLNNNEVSLREADNSEMAMLDNLHCKTDNCRLTCQLQVNEKMHLLKIKVSEKIFA
ncbi:MAG: 2Fe-2S iron-sulfur cluster binding domain-containing protein [Chitinophagales bacterium]|nr:2Fe-2S iron-sulfur cluster-binding protein [Chitinophagales bacterium]MCZ2394839.1 2Fe-2S iron-sulfur cluster binding domain-containing protein [Chitinophagales bacterium]